MYDASFHNIFARAKTQNPVNLGIGIPIRFRRFGFKLQLLNFFSNFENFQNK